MELEQASLLVMTIKLKRNGWVCVCVWVGGWVGVPLSLDRHLMSHTLESSKTMHIQYLSIFYLRGPGVGGPLR